jgi:hypothetical protein
MDRHAHEHTPDTIHDWDLTPFKDAGPLDIVHVEGALLHQAWEMPAELQDHIQWKDIQHDAATICQWFADPDPNDYEEYTVTVPGYGRMCL